MECNKCKKIIPLEKEIYSKRLWWDKECFKKAIDDYKEYLVFCEQWLKREKWKMLILTIFYPSVSYLIYLISNNFLLAMTPLLIFCYIMLTWPRKNSEEFKKKEKVKPF